MSTHPLTRRDAIRLSAGVIAALSYPPASFANRARFEAVSCERLADGRLRVRWTTQPAGMPVDVSVSEEPRAKSALMLSKSNVSGVFEGSAPVQGRPYFHLATGDLTRTVAERVLPLQGGRNFRDLGGYQTPDSRSVRWGVLFRSGTMASLTDADYEYLGALGIRIVCDLRTLSERQHEPDSWRGGAKPAYLTHDYEMDSKLWQTVKAPDITPERVRDMMKQLYATMPYLLIEHYRSLFAEIASGRTPLAFHCSAGKDRTGIATGLVLTALGIPRSTILEDYALSDQIVNYEASVMKDAAKPQQGPYDFIARLPKEIRAPLLRSDPLYLEAAFGEMDRREGSVPGFVHKRLGIDDTALAAIRENVLERE